MENSIQSLFFNAWEVVQTTSFFLYIFIGGRGIGKTYSMLKGLLEDNKYFMYVRRTESELKNCCQAENNPFNRLNIDLNRHVEMSSSADSFIIHEDDKILGISGSLSTFGKFRGSDFSNVDYIVFDEFIFTGVRNTLKNEDYLFFNMIETVQRNREILGLEPIKVILLANSNRLDNDILKSLRLGEVIHQMKVNNHEVWIDNERGIYLALPHSLGITEKKKETALYKLTKGSDFYDMSIQNDFVSDSFELVKKIDIKNCIPIVRYENVTFYSIKDNNKIYASYRKADCPCYTHDTLKRFKYDYGLILGDYIESKNIYYYDYDIKLIIDSIF